MFLTCVLVKLVAANLTCFEARSGEVEVFL